jgi:photosystem II stability/assembly factor-like uncharacterized protein
MKMHCHTIYQTKSFLIIVWCLFVTVNPIFAQTWTLTSAPTNEFWGILASSGDGNKLLAVSQRGVYTSTNSGTNWTKCNPPLSGNALKSGASSADGTILLAGDYLYIYISTNSGNTWFRSHNAPQDYWFSIACSADGNKMVAAPYYDITGNPQPIYLSKDTGTTWTAATTPSNHWTAVASSADGSVLFALPSQGPIYLSTNSGTTWTSNSTVGYWVSAACSADGKKAVAVANPGLLYTSTNSGVAWSSHFVAGAGTGFGSVASSADGKSLVAVGYQGNTPIFVSTNSGNSWVRQTNASLIALWNAVASSADGHKMFAATCGFLVNDSSGGIYRLQTTPSPRMNLILLSTNLAFLWTVPSANFVLQQNVDLNTSNWMTLTDTPALNLTNLQNQVMLSPTNSSGFYRLATP